MQRYPDPVTPLTRITLPGTSTKLGEFHSKGEGQGVVLTSAHARVRYDVDRLVFMGSEVEFLQEVG